MANPKRKLSMTPRAIKQREDRARKAAEAKAKRAAEGNLLAGEKMDEFGIDAFCEAIRNGKSYRHIAEEVGVSLGLVSDWLARQPDRLARAKSAMVSSADAYAAKAEEVLSKLDKDATKAQQMVARELAQHYRWMAAKRNPDVYSERQKVDLKTDVSEASSDQLMKELGGLVEAFSPDDKAQFAALMGMDGALGDKSTKH